MRMNSVLAAPGAFLAVVQLAMFFFAGSIIPIALDASANLTELQPYVEAVLP